MQCIANSVCVYAEKLEENYQLNKKKSISSDDAGASNSLPRIIEQIDLEGLGYLDVVMERVCYIRSVDVESRQEYAVIRVHSG